MYMIMHAIHLKLEEQALNVIPDFHFTSIIAEWIGRDHTNSTLLFLYRLFAFLTGASSSLGVLHTIASISHSLQ